MSKTIITIFTLLALVICAAAVYVNLAPPGAPPVLYLMAKSLMITAWIMVVLVLAKMVIPGLLVKIRSQNKDG